MRNSNQDESSKEMVVARKDATDYDWKEADFLSFGDDEEPARDNETTSTPATESARPRNRGRMSIQVDEYPTSVNQKTPWQGLIASKVISDSACPLIKLHNEIVNFVKLMEPQPQEALERASLIKQVTRLVEETFGECRVEVFGSQATGLYLPSSDVDLVVHLTQDSTKEKKSGKKRKRDEKNLSRKQLEAIEMEEFTKDLKQGKVSTKEHQAASENLSVYQRLSETLKKHHVQHSFRLSYLEVIENTRIPVVKFTHAESKVSVDVCFNQEGGVEAAKYMNTCQEQIPALRPLVFVLKYFLVSRGMNETYTGGMGSFLMQLLIVSYLQQRRREECNSGKHARLYRPNVQANLGAMLLEFLELYGVDFNYCTTGISVRYGGYYFPKGASDKAATFASEGKFLVAVEHPLETTLDVGRGAFRMLSLQRAFEAAFRTLTAHLSDPVVPTISILGTILPPMDEMWTRREMVSKQQLSSATQNNSNSRRSPVNTNNDYSSQQRGRTTFRR